VRETEFAHESHTNHRIPDSVVELLLRGNSDSEFGSTGHVYYTVVSREPKIRRWSSREIAKPTHTHAGNGQHN
jgi:hypothetical protein